MVSPKNTSLLRKTHERPFQRITKHENKTIISLSSSVIPNTRERIDRYLIKSQQRSHDLSPTKMKKLVYSFVIFNSIPVPPSSVKCETAGKEWFTNFLKRNKGLSIRESTSQARAAGLNKVVMNNLYEPVICL